MFLQSFLSYPLSCYQLGNFSPQQEGPKNGFLAKRIPDPTLIVLQVQENLSSIATLVSVT